MRRKDVTPEQMLNGGQVICGRNATRRLLNSAMKRRRASRMPIPKGGARRSSASRTAMTSASSTACSSSSATSGTRTTAASAPIVRTEDGAAVPGRLACYKGEFDDHVSYDPEREPRDWKLKREA